MKLNCIVVDDSSIQRILICKLVEESKHLNLVGEYPNAIEAKIALSNKPIDLIFLDIEMPIVNGFNLIDGLKEKPQIIFITAKAEYALKAFEYEATDYLQKPISKERFNQAIKKAYNMHMLKKDSLDEEPEHIFVKSNLKKLKIYTHKIHYIEAFGDYIKIVTDDNEFMVLSTMKAYESILNKDKFRRIHKSYLINVDKVINYDSKSVNIGTIILPLSRAKKDDLIAVLNS